MKLSQGRMQVEKLEIGNIIFSNKNKNYEVLEPKWFAEIHS